jgi:hypothetical protein
MRKNIFIVTVILASFFVIPDDWTGNIEEEDTS